MSKSASSVEVLHIEFQAPVFVPSWGPSPTTLPSPTRSLDHLKMLATDLGVVVETNTVSGSVVKFLVPYTNLKVVQLKV